MGRMGWMGYLLGPTLRAPYGANKLETELKMPVKTVQPRSAGDKMQPHALIWV